VVAVVKGREYIRVVFLDPFFGFGLDSELPGGDEVEINACRRKGGGRGRMRKQ